MSPVMSSTQVPFLRSINGLVQLLGNLLVVGNLDLENQPEVAILDYQSHQHKHMPMSASTYAFHLSTTNLVEKYSKIKKTNDEELVTAVHALSAGLKAYVTSYTVKSLSTFREACEAHGYTTVNRFGSWRNDHDIFRHLKETTPFFFNRLHAIF
ncbi:hypothetical protein KIW84_032684 [Lathyrus oleraceus]|uniref:Acyl-CoA oxidase C-alpha1 domain-containing protein n=1 Tax=Pisum sativum TaxID=3888 RepID=A0A9D4XWE3_PEA|nr:hypothetical protein KIW84_032684 [Pisum sativum]